MKIYDISPLIHPGMAVWPGDIKFSRQEGLRLSQGAPVNLSSITLSLHTGSHADAPAHFSKDGKSIDDVDLAPYFGPARVITLRVPDRVRGADIEATLRQPPERLLVRCNPSLDPDKFPESFIYFAPGAATRIGEAGVKLIGIDSPSVDDINSDDLPAHHIFCRYRTAILENIDLRQVPDGEYELSALPLKIAGGDASPVRAVLRELA